MSCAVRSRRRPPRPPARILVVEDEQLVAAGTQAILEDAGYQVAGIAATAEDAVALTAAERPDLVLMDIQLAGPRSGVEAAVEIAERFGTGIVFVSAWADSQIRQRAEPARALGWVVKPYDPVHLLADVARAMATLPARRA